MSRFCKIGVLLIFALLSTAALRADTYRILDDETEALQCRIDMIRQAREEILVSYYILKDDKIGKPLLRLLAEAASQRGVAVRIIMDSNGSRVSGKMLAYLRENGVEVRKFRIGRWYFLRRYSHRLHDKILLTDGKWLLVGGRNIKAEYYGLGKKFNFTDRDVLVTGKAACREARFHFYNVWNSGKLSRWTRKVQISPDEQRQFADYLLVAQAELERLLPVRFDNDRVLDEKNEPATASPVHFYHDHFFKKKGQRYVETEHKNKVCTDSLIALVDSARFSILIENPYFNPTRDWMAAFQRALDRGVRIRVLTNSIQSTDLLVRQAAYLNRRKKLVRSGLEMYEYRNHKKLHTKAMLVDDALSQVGSYNLHFLSQKNNTEVALSVLDPAAAREHRRIALQNFESAVKISPDNRPQQPPGLHLPGAPFGRRALTWVFRWTVAPWL